MKESDEDVGHGPISQILTKVGCWNRINAHCLYLSAYKIYCEILTSYGSLHACKVFRAAPFWAVTQRVVAIPYRRLRNNLSVPCFLDSWPLKMGQIGCLETSMRYYQYWLRHNPEERSSHLLRGGSLKSRVQNLVSAVLLGSACLPVVWVPGTWG